MANTCNALKGCCFHPYFAVFFSCRLLIVGCQVCLSVLVVCRGLSGVGSVSSAECNVMSLPVFDVDSGC